MREREERERERYREREDRERERDREGEREGGLRGATKRKFLETCHSGGGRGRRMISNR